jgi:toxin ParE1/3/4
LKKPAVTELARSDLDKIWDHIGPHNPAAADRLIDLIRAQCLKLASSPHRGKRRPDFAEGLYSYRVKNYFIYYFVTDGGIEVARVLHGARDLPKIF